MINVARDPWRNGLLLFEKDVWEWWTFPPQILAPRYFFVILFRNTEFKNDEPKVQEHVVKKLFIVILVRFFYFTWVYYVIIYVLLLCVLEIGNLTKKKSQTKNKRPFLINYGKTSCFSALVTKHKYISLPEPLFNIAQGSQVSTLGKKLGMDWIYIYITM